MQQQLLPIRLFDATGSTSTFDPTVRPRYVDVGDAHDTGDTGERTLAVIDPVVTDGSPNGFELILMSVFASADPAERAGVV